MVEVSEGQLKGLVIPRLTDTDKEALMEKALRKGWKQWAMKGEEKEHELGIKIMDKLLIKEDRANETMKKYKKGPEFERAKRDIKSVKSMRRMLKKIDKEDFGNANWSHDPSVLEDVPTPREPTPEPEADAEMKPSEEPTEDEEVEIIEPPVSDKRWMVIRKASDTKIRLLGPASVGADVNAAELTDEERTITDDINHSV